MTAASPTALAPTRSEIARLCVEIDDVTPRVRRVVEVPVDIRLDDLHFVLQVAIGWQNGHPFEFRIGEAAWGLPDRDGDADVAHAQQATLAEILARGDTFKYDYVLGEDWEHIVTLLACAPAGTDTSYPHLVHAEGRCPPADIGGPVGYETYLRTIADPTSLHHDEMLAFDAPDFDPHVVDEAALRRNLAELGRYIGRKPTIHHAEARASKDAAEVPGPSSFGGRSTAASG
jgi:hypothetical protein